MTRAGVRRRRVPAVVAGLFAALAVLAAVLLATSATSITAHVGENVFVNPDAPIDANNSATLARNPKNPANVVVVHRVDLPRFSAALEVSHDGGRAWETTAAGAPPTNESPAPPLPPGGNRPPPFPLPAGKDRPYAIDAVFALDGTLYVSFVNLQGGGNRPDNLWVARSDDGGRTLGPLARVTGPAPPLAFQARMTVDPKGVLYVTWGSVADVAPYAIVGYPSPVVVSRSTDGARTFSEPVAVSDADRMRVGAASPAIDSDGNLVVLYEDFKDDSRDYLNLDGPPWENPFTLVVTVSKDGGKTFSKGVEVDHNLVPRKRFLVFLPEFPSLAAGPDRSLYVSWADARNGDQDAFIRRSGDGGATWGAPVRINDNRLRDGTDQYMPKVAVAPGGRVDVVFLDRRRDRTNIRDEAYLGLSEDHGTSFRNIRLSTSSFDSRVGFSANSKLEADLGSRLGLVSSDTEILAAWTDTRLGTEDTARQDIVAATILVSKKAAPALGRAPVVFGSLAGAALCLLAWWASGRERMVPRAAGAETRSVEA